MNPPIETMRAFVKKMYDGDRWHRRVRRMNDSQVTAIYLKQQAKIAQAEMKKKKDQDEPPPF